MVKVPNGQKGQKYQQGSKGLVIQVVIRFKVTIDHQKGQKAKKAKMVKEIKWSKGSNGQRNQMVMGPNGQRGQRSQTVRRTK